MEKKTENYRHGPDGTLLVKKLEPLRIGGFDTMLSGREVWFPCSLEDPDRQYRKMVLGGWFGYHKFQEKRWLAGLFYLLTCGCFGVFYLYDLTAMLSGSYFYKRVTYEQGENGIERRMHKIYYGPMEDRKRGLLLLIVAVVLVGAAIFFLYRPLGNVLIAWLSEVISGSVTEEEIGRLLWIMQ